VADLAYWLSTNVEALVEAATEKLAPNETLKAQVVESIEAFYDSLMRAVHFNDPTHLYPLLVDWVETRSAPTDDDPTVMLPILAKLKQATQEQIRLRCTPEEAVDLLMAVSSLLDDVMTRLAGLETESLVAGLRNKLRSAEIKLELLDKSKSDFIAIAAHELKTPLTVIEGYTGILRGLATSTQEQTVVGGIDTGVKRLKEIVDDIVDISLIDLSMLELNFQPVWLHHLMDAVESQVSDLVTQRRLRLVVVRDNIPLQHTFGDAERLLQVLVKVVMNAIKYTSDGGQITISGRELPGFVDLMVQDEGIGIAPRDLQRIFDAFSSIGDVSLHSSGKTKFKGGGPGLGLPIAKGIVEAHGGTIWAQSAGYSETDHPGSTFHIMIPMRNSPPPERVDGMVNMESANEE
jgi:signal transduction histidine kinase